MGAVDQGYERAKSFRRTHDRQASKYAGDYVLKTEKVLSPGSENEYVLPAGTVVSFVDIVAEAHRFEVTLSEGDVRTFDVMPIKVDALLRRLSQ